MATPEELSREELERRAALGVLELDDDELLIQSTQAEPTYKIGEPDIHEYDLDDRGSGSTLLEQYHSRQLPGEGESGSTDEPRGRPAGDYFKDKAVDAAHWGLAALSVADPTMTTDLVDAALYKMMGDAETAREVIYWSAGGLGAGALVNKLVKLAKVRRMRRSLQSEFEAKGYPQEAAEEASGRVFNLAAARWEQKIRGDLPVSSQYGRGRGQGSVVDLERTPSGLRAAESDSPMDRAYARMKQADIEESYGASNIKPRYSERSDMTESEALRWLLEVRDGYQKRLSTGTRNEAVRIKKLDDVYENFERTGDLNRLFDEIELTDVLPIEDLERRIPSLSIARKKQGGPDIRKMVEEDPAAREEFMDFLAKEERELQARRAAKPPVLREVEPSSALDRFDEELRDLRALSNKARLHPDLDDKLFEMDAMNDALHKWFKSPEDSWRVKEAENLYEQFEKTGNLDRFANDLVLLEKATPSQYQYKMKVRARRAGKPSPSQAPPAPEAPAAGSKPPWQMTRAEFEATGEELMHGTDVPFDRFMSKVAKDRYGAKMGQGKESLGRFYFTEQPNVARSMSDATRAGGHRQVDFDKWAEQQGQQWIPSNDPVWDDLLEELHSDVRKDMKRKPGRVLAYIDHEKGPNLIKVNDPSEIPKMAWAEQYDIRLYEPERWPRVIKTNVYGRTLDLTDPKNVPDDLAKLLKEEGRFDPIKQTGGWEHEFSPALVKYARENNYGKIKVRDSHESGGRSTIGIEEYIGYGVDPHHAFVEKAIREGKDVPEDVLRRYPDLYALKWGTPKPPRGPSGGGSGAPAAGVVETATDTPAFKSWFGGSKVVDEAGEPMVVYHGTTGDFDAFQPVLARGDAYFFSVSPDYASKWAMNRGRRFIPEAEVEFSRLIRESGKAFDSNSGVVTNPEALKRALVETDVLNERVAQRLNVGWDEVEGVSADKIAKAFTEEFFPAEASVIPAYLRSETPYNTKSTGLDWRKFDDLGVDWFKSRGFDSVWIKEGPKGKAGSIVVFTPTQIKSKFNRGTFDPTDPRILYGAGLPPAAILKSQLRKDED